MLKLIKLNECGYDEALLGMSLSFYDHAEPLDKWWDDDKMTRAVRRANALAFKGGGHNKFLESISIHLYIQATRGFWSEFDTYRVGMTKNSSSTMHTLDKRPTDINDYASGTSQLSIDAFNICLLEYKDPESQYYKDITRLKCNLPEGWLQERQISTNYMVLQNILKQREGHRLKYWKQFSESLLEQVDHPELLIRNTNE